MSWLKLALVCAACVLAFLVMRRPRSAPAPATVHEPRLEMPLAHPLRTSDSLRASMNKKPAVPPSTEAPAMAAQKPFLLDCENPQSIREFKRIGMFEWQVFPPEAEFSYIEQGATCLCGQQAQEAGLPPLPERTDKPRELPPACPDRASARAAEDSENRIKGEYIEIAKFFHEHLPIDKVQAVKLAECYCGPL